MHGVMAAAHRMGMGNCGQDKVVGRHGRVGRARMGLLRLLVRVVCIGRLRARLRSAPSALRRAVLVRVVCEHGRDGRACIGRLRVCALRIGRLRVCLRSAPFALNCDCRSFALLPMQLCLYMLSVRYLR